MIRDMIDGIKDTFKEALRGDGLAIFFSIFILVLFGLIGFLVLWVIDSCSGIRVSVSGTVESKYIQPGYMETYVVDKTPVYIWHPEENRLLVSTNGVSVSVQANDEQFNKAKQGDHVTVSYHTGIIFGGRNNWRLE